MLEKVPGAYINLGHGEASAPVHNDRYDFSDEATLRRGHVWPPCRTYPGAGARRGVTSARFRVAPSSCGRSARPARGMCPLPVGFLFQTSRQSGPDARALFLPRLNLVFSALMVRHWHLFVPIGISLVSVATLRTLASVNGRPDLEADGQAFAIKPARHAHRR